MMTGMARCIMARGAVGVWKRRRLRVCAPLCAQHVRTRARARRPCFPRGVADVDLDHRDYKYARTVHAEMNALLFTNGKLEGATMYIWPMPPCSRCAGPIIQAGIVRVISPPAGERWEESCKIGREMFDQAGVEVMEVNL